MSPSEYAAQVFIYTASGLAVTVLTVAGTHQVKTRGSRKRLEQMVANIATALLGEPVSEFRPNPEPGLVERVNNYQKAMDIRTDMGDKLIEAFTAQEQVVSEIKLTLVDVTAATVENGRDIKELKVQIARAATNAEVAATNAAKTAKATQAATSKNGGESSSVGDTAARTEDTAARTENTLADLITRLEAAEVIEKKE